MAMTLTRLAGAKAPDSGPKGGYRLALDLGTNSIGWCLLDLDAEGEPRAIRGMGSRIFSDGRNPKDGASLAVGRRLARQMRRRRDRYVKRRARFMEALIRYGLMPEDPAERKALENLDPYEVRAKGLTERLEPHALGRALFHLNQRRGFQSNRVVDKDDEKETGRVKGAIAELRARLEGHETLGAWMWERHKERQGVRARTTGTGAKDPYVLYVHRDMIAHEFDALWEKQRRHHPTLLTDAARDRLRDILLFQRPLRPVPVGRCTVEPDDTRAPWALPIAQRFRILQELNHLRVQGPGVKERALTPEERDKLRDKLLGQKEVPFEDLHKLLDLPEGHTFQAGFVRRGKLKGDETAATLRHKDRFGRKGWDALTPEAQAEVVEKLISDETDEAAVAAWLRERFGLAEANARKVATTRLPQGHARFGRKALAKIVPILDAEVITLDKAVERAGYDPHFHPDEILPALPYYAIPLAAHVMPAPTAGNPVEREHGRIGNPTVHVALNQVRKVVNEVIRRHGHPAEIVVELARDLKSSKEQKDEYREQQKKNTERNARHAAELAALGQENNGENRLRLRLWEELGPDPLNRRCVYTGEQIGKHRLFRPEVEIDHILPFSRTLDDGAGNKNVSLRRANRDKAQKSPHEAFANSPAGYDWNGVVARVTALPEGKRWRFGPDAMERFEQDEGFLARHLNDTRYLSRMAREYLSVVCPFNRVWVTPGRLTEMLRGKWGVNKLLGEQDAKNRNDHRHHAIDAAVVGVTDRSTLMKVQHAAGVAEVRGAGRVLESLDLPWPDFYRDLEAAVGRIVVSHKPEHGVSGQLHEETAYGLVAGPDAKGYLTLQVHKPLSGMGPGDLKDMADDNLRERLVAATAGLSGPDFKKAVADFARETGIRRLRVTVKKRPEGLVAIGRPAYKHYPGGSNYCVEIVERTKGSRTVWDGEFITTFQANQRPYRTFREDTARFRCTTFSGRPLVMRLIAGDAVALERPEDQGRRTIWRVRKLAQSGQINLDPHQEGGALDKRNKDPDDSFKNWAPTIGALHGLKARRVFVDILGRVKDPGWGDAGTDRGDRPGGVPPARGARVPGGAGGP